MLLNCFAQPILLQSHKTYFCSEELKNAPLLLCHKNAMREAVLPPDWSGKIFATQEVLNETEIMQHKFPTTSVHTLCPNETYIIELPKDEDCQYKPKHIEITAIPWGKEYLMYLIKDDIVVNLLTDIFTEDMSVFVQNKILHNGIKCGIDVLYLNDAVYHSNKKINAYPSEFLLEALLIIVRPRFIKGFFSEDQLPQHIEDCCVRKEF